MEIYRIQFTSRARQDLRDSYNYIKNELKEPAAAERFYLNIEKNIETLTTTPGRYAVIDDDRLIEREYRKLIVGNHIVFYSIDEENKTVMIKRILYARRDWLNLL